MPDMTEFSVNQSAWHPPVLNAYLHALMDIEFSSFLTWLIFAEADINFFNKMAHTSYESPTCYELYIAIVNLVQF